MLEDDEIEDGMSQKSPKGHMLSSRI